MDNFEKFWQTYPPRNGRRNGKELCRKIVQAFSEPDQCLLVQAAKHYAKSTTQNGATWQPLPRDPIRFLKHDFWRDFIEGALIQCSFRTSPPCEQPCEVGTDTCQFHREYREKLNRIRRLYT